MVAAAGDNSMHAKGCSNHAQMEQVFLSSARFFLRLTLLDQGC